MSWPGSECGEWSVMLVASLAVKALFFVFASQLLAASLRTVAVVAVVDFFVAFLAFLA